jgi:hypothetical protein
MRWEGHVARMEEINAYKFAVGISKRKKPGGRPKEYNIKMELIKRDSAGVNWIQLVQGRV